MPSEVVIKSLNWPSTGKAPNAPSGWTTITDRPWDALEEDGWGQIVQKPVIEADDSGPVTPGSVGASYFPEGEVDPATTPRAGINFYRGNETFGEVYVSMHVFVTSNFIGHESGTNKVFWVLDAETGGGGDPFFMKLQGVDDGVLTLAGTVQHPDLQNREFRWDGAENQVNPTEAEAQVARGEWTNIEMRLKINTIGSNDGEFHGWVDGTKVLEFTSVEYIDSASDGLFDELQWAPMWGGTGDAGPIPADMGFKIDHLFVSIT